MSNMPENWTPPVDAWQARFADGVQEIVFAYFGVQCEPGCDISEFEAWWAQAGQLAPLPSFITRAHYRDASDLVNDIFIAYWPSHADFQAWWDTPQVHAWWLDDARLTGPFGLWREVFTVPVDHFETLHSSRTQHGAANLSHTLGEPVREHAYWGGMRDRVAASSQLDFASPLGTDLPDVGLKASRGARLTAKLPDNLCLIRSGQDLADSEPGEKQSYQDVVRPHLTAGMAFLRDNPAETRCISCRLMDETHLDGKPSAQTFGLCLFLSMADLESWAHSHPTHLAIFNSFFEMVEKRGGELSLRLWHEVLVADGHKTLCEYTNCHPRTGVLPYFDVV